jgi:hypothetical protein
MPSKMAIRIMGEGGWDWDEITRLDLDTKKDIDVLIMATDQQVKDSELKAEKRAKALTLVDPNFVNPQKRNEEILKSVGDYEDAEIAEFLDTKTYSDRKAIAKASEAIQFILMGKEPLVWYGANVAFMQKIVDFASDKRATLGDKFQKLMDYAMSHKEIAMQNVERITLENSLIQQKQNMMAQPAESKAVNPGVSGGVSRAMNIGEAMVA